MVISKTKLTAIISISKLTHQFFELL